jgi:hypothetical protein
MPKQIKQHGIAYTASVARRATANVTHFLETYWPQTVAVHNVEADPAYQQVDVDLLWTVMSGNGRLRTISIEIKGDRYHRTGNFFFETVSNAEKNTPGCFLYTRATWLFYIFVEVGALYCLPMQQARPWFLHNQERFREQRTSTPVGTESYVTIGCLVPIQTVLEEVRGVLGYQKENEGWKQIWPQLME